MTKTVWAFLAAMTVLPAAATDTSSIGAFAESCSSDMNGCRSIVLGAVISARNAHYGCIPRDVSDKEATEKLLEWLRDTAAKNPKYADEPLADLMWTGVDHLWPCRKK
jgi:hypothetical protein